MILFLADYPEGDATRDGMAQRILAVDRLFQNRPRTYLRLSLRRFWIPRIRRTGQRTVIRAHTLTGLPLVLFLAVRCRTVYLHSVAGALHAPYLLPLVRSVLDLHGILPEEQLMLGHRRRARALERAEALCVRFATAVVCVTARMAEHLGRKYPGSRSRRVVVPIMQPLETTPRPSAADKRAAGRLRVVYSGGVQPWQNVDRMVEAMRASRAKVDFAVFTPAVEVFRSRLETAGVDAEVRSLDTDALHGRYRDMHLGLVLRDPDLVNRVACPTKLSEYMHFGIVPVVLQPEIGDMATLGYQYVLLADFEAGALPSEAALEEMRERNWEVLDRWQRQFRAGTEELVALVEGRPTPGGAT